MHALLQSIYSFFSFIYPASVFRFIDPVVNLILVVSVTIGGGFLYLFVCGAIAKAERDSMILPWRIFFTLLMVYPVLFLGLEMIKFVFQYRDFQGYIQNILKYLGGAGDIAINSIAVWKLLGISFGGLLALVFLSLVAENYSSRVTELNMTFELKGLKKPATLLMGLTGLAAGLTFAITNLITEGATATALINLDVLFAASDPMSQFMLIFVSVCGFLSLLVLVYLLIRGHAFGLLAFLIILALAVLVFLISAVFPPAVIAGGAILMAFAIFLPDDKSAKKKGPAPVGTPPVL